MKKSFNYIFWCFTLLAVVFTSCKKDDNNYPELQTLTITPLQPGSALFKGSIISTGDLPVADYGFVYGNWSNVDITTGMKVSLGKDAKKGEFTKEVSSIYSSNYDNTIYVRSYITNAEGTAYGKAISAILPRPTASNISPSAAKVGDIVTIFGNFYTTKKEDVSVLFGNKNAKVLDLSTSQIKAEVPSGVLENQCSVYIAFKGSQSILVNGNFIFKPNIIDFYPKSGPLGTIITFTGEHLHTYYYSAQIYFGNTLAGLYSDYNNVYKSTITNVPSDKFKIAYVTEGLRTELPDEFTVNMPKITSISPATALPGQTVTVTGTDFPLTYGECYLEIGNANIYIGNILNSPFTFTVPGIKEGDYTIKLKFGQSSATSTQKLQVKSHSVSSVSPLSGAVGKEITLTGVFVPNLYYYATIGNVQTANNASSSTTLKLTVPYGATIGNSTIKVQYGEQIVTAPGTFEVIPPKITSISPISGVPGTIVTITGAGFDTSTWNTIVKFGTVQTSIISVTENTIKVAVPSNVLPGAMKIAVTTYGQTITSPQNFTLTN
ncbi:IPT/TIG domain-containing protein [Solitalea canadensis]|uniref:IPT/TIG domain-containing protein n=1 Tax=Solitalea canadensis (strain ATCC 29591 / DSM 3403 / JCM 21819 / LMG 8368 / NBRC 15130 / NCIMB 12057 / USAM 9D) TaxID=929556 RepID=H8KT30_SOLCM|nr:IPT/TIG domain-containing protein [Solitalea canadensis]AFD05601.1 IPT/TIG domain-containing protein [Solitalea canadensis DSM 3403]